MTQGEFIDNMSMDEILNHPQFFSLQIEKGVYSAPDYWQVTFESNKKDENGKWLDLAGNPILNKKFRYFKLKK